MPRLRMDGMTVFPQMKMLIGASDGLKSQLNLSQALYVLSKVLADRVMFKAPATHPLFPLARTLGTPSVAMGRFQVG